jgi:hypothetical protein
MTLQEDDLECVLNELSNDVIMLDQVRIVDSKQDLQQRRQPRGNKPDSADSETMLETQSRAEAWLD